MTTEDELKLAKIYRPEDNVRENQQFSMEKIQNKNLVSKNSK